MQRFVVIPLVLISLSVARNSTNAIAQEVVPRIINGVETNDFPEVGIVGSTEYPGGFASGTLITSRHVLTAAHVAAVISGPTDGLFIVNGGVYFTSRIFIHEDYDDRFLLNDIAILELSEAVPNVMPALINVTTPIVGDRVTIVGYGSGGSDAGSDGGFGVRMVGETTVDYVGSKILAWTFDSGESNTAPGDSGGPAYLEIDNELFIAGITSGGTDPNAAVGDFAFDTRVDAYVAWIDAVIAEYDDGTDDTSGGATDGTGDATDDGTDDGASDTTDGADGTTDASDTPDACPVYHHPGFSPAHHHPPVHDPVIRRPGRPSIGHYGDFGHSPSVIVTAGRRPTHSTPGIILPISPQRRPNPPHSAASASAVPSATASFRHPTSTHRSHRSTAVDANRTMSSRRIPGKR